MLKKAVKILLSSLGIGIHKVQSLDQTNKIFKAKAIQDEIDSNKWLIEKEFRAIIDIGSNTGQFARRMRQLFPEAMIYSFEPIPSVFTTLINNFKDDKNFKAFNFGLGDNEKEVYFNLNEYSDSSSLLKMNDLHKANFPYTEQESVIKILVKRLDDIFESHEIPKPYLLKLDVQGYEDKVINGGIKITSESSLIISEVSYFKLYDEQVLFDDIYLKLRRLGFEFKGNFDQLRSPLNNSILQADAIFEKKN